MPLSEAVYLRLARFGVRGLLTLLAVALVSILLWLTVGINLTDFAQGAILMAFGKGLGWLDMIFSFEFGSSRSSQVKDATIQSLSATEK